MLTALAEKVVGRTDLFASGVADKGGGVCIPRDRVHACTLEAYAETKSLSAAFLRNLGLSDLEAPPIGE